MPVESEEEAGPKERIRFEFEDCTYEARGFIHDGGPSEVSGDVMFEITGGRESAISDLIDITALQDFLEGNPRHFRMYRLVTGETDPKHPDKVFYYSFDGNGWNKMFNHRHSKWGKEYLVVHLVLDPQRGVFGSELC